MMTFELKINSINCKTEEKGLTDVVKSIDWEYTGTDGSIVVKERGQQEVPEPNPASFIATKDLTKVIVTKWLTDIFNTEKPAGPIMKEKGFTVMTKFDQLQNMLNKRAEKQKNPPVPENSTIDFASLK